jgi:hypothetical protein
MTPISQALIPTINKHYALPDANNWAIFKLPAIIMRGDLASQEPGTSVFFKMLSRYLPLLPSKTLSAA